MRIVAIILTVAGALNLATVGLALARGGLLSTNALPMVLSALLFAIGIGTLKKQFFAWILGFAFLAVAGIQSVLVTFTFTAESTGFERWILVGSALIGLLIVLGVFATIWRRQKSYFCPDQSGANQAPDPTRLARPDSERTSSI